MIVFPLPDALNDEFNELLSRYLDTDVQLGEQSDGWDFDFASSNFPEWLLLEDPQRAQLLIPELALMVKDQFDHHLGALHSFVLFNLIEGWIEIERERAKLSKEDASEAKKDVKLLEEYLGTAFPYRLFLRPEVIAAEAIDAAALGRPVHPDTIKFLELLPRDIRREVRRAIASKPRARGDDSHSDSGIT